MSTWGRRQETERRKFTREFKLEAVKLITERGVSYAQASIDLEIHQSVLRNCVKAFAEDPEHSFPGHGRLKPEQAQLMPALSNVPAEGLWFGVVRARFWRF